MRDLGSARNHDFHLLPLLQLVAVEAVEEQGEEEVEHHEVSNLGFWSVLSCEK